MASQSLRECLKELKTSFPYQELYEVTESELFPHERKMRWCWWESKQNIKNNTLDDKLDLIHLSTQTYGELLKYPQLHALCTNSFQEADCGLGSNWATSYPGEMGVLWLSKVAITEKHRLSTEKFAQITAKNPSRREGVWLQTVKGFAKVPLPFAIAYYANLPVLRRSLETYPRKRFFESIDTSSRTMLQYVCLGYNEVVDGNKKRRQDRVECFELLLALDPAQLPLRDRDGRTLLHLACERGHLGLAKLLVEKYKLPNEKARCRRYDLTPFLMAAKNGHLDIVEYFCSPSCTSDVSSESKFRALELIAGRRKETESEMTHQVKLAEIVFRSMNGPSVELWADAGKRMHQSSADCGPSSIVNALWRSQNVKLLKLFAKTGHIKQHLVFDCRASGHLRPFGEMVRDARDQIAAQQLDRVKKFIEAVLNEKPSVLLETGREYRGGSTLLHHLLKLAARSDEELRLKNVLRSALAGWKDTIQISEALGRTNRNGESLLHIWLDNAKDANVYFKYAAKNGIMVDGRCPYLQITELILQIQRRAKMHLEILAPDLRGRQYLALHNFCNFQTGYIHHSLNWFPHFSEVFLATMGILVRALSSPSLGDADRKRLSGLPYGVADILNIPDSRGVTPLRMIVQQPLNTIYDPTNWRKSSSVSPLFRGLARLFHLDFRTRLGTAGLLPHDRMFVRWNQSDMIAHFKEIVLAHDGETHGIGIDWKVDNVAKASYLALNAEDSKRKDATMVIAFQAAFDRSHTREVLL